MEPIVNANDVSRISSGTVIKGEITSQNDIRIDGKFEGKVISKGKVFVGEKAVIKGDIICQNVDFAGTMTGNFYVKDTLALKDNCKVDGDLHVRRLQVELNAVFNGKCVMISEADFAKLTEGMTGNPKPETAQPRPAGQTPQAPQAPQAKPVSYTGQAPAK